MKQKDHRALAGYLLDSIGRSDMGAGNRRFFVLGCILPDYLPYTYLRGFCTSRAMRGHNLPYSNGRIRKILTRLEKKGIRTRLDWFRLGTLMHYLADSFTYPHNESFAGSIRAHRQYEQQLHTCFARYLQPMCANTAQGLPIGDYLCRRREEYNSTPPTAERDCRQIVRACTAVFAYLTNAPAMPAR